MIPLPDWFSRKFTFDFSYEVFPGVVERLRGTPARLAELVSNIPSHILTQRDGEEWSIQEHIGHLYDLSELDLARLQDYHAGATTLRVADLNNQRTHQANHNADTMAHVLELFWHERGKLVSQLEAVDVAFVQRIAVHPRLQIPMRLVDWCYFVAEHDDHHVAFISMLLRKSAN